MALRLTGLATAQPPHSAAQEACAEVAAALNQPAERQRRVMMTLYRRSGVQRRGSVLLTPGNGRGPEQHFYHAADDADDLGPTTAQRMHRYAADALPLAARAAVAALEDAARSDASLDPSSVTHLVTASCTGFAAPGTDVQLIDELGLSRGVQRTHVGFMGCHGAFNALRVADGLMCADPHGVALVCAFELCSLHFRYGAEPQQVVANALFADGAAAAVCRHEPREAHAAHAPPISDRPSNNGDDHPWRVAAFASHVVPDTGDAMTWQITDHGFAMTLSPQLPDRIHATLRPWLETWLEKLGLAIDAVGSWAVHPGGPRILSAVSDSLAIGDDAVADSRAVLAEHGNMSSPTILFILDRLRRRRAPRPCVALGFGPGLTIEAMLLV